MTPDLQAIIYPVRDLEAATTLFAALLGSRPVMAEPYYVQFATGGPDLGLDPHGHDKGMTGPVPYWAVPDIRAAVADLLSAGGELRQDVQDVGGRLIATVADADGNPVGLIGPV